jgi:hypothetical protein
MTKRLKRGMGRGHSLLSDSFWLEVASNVWLPYPSVFIQPRAHQLPLFTHPSLGALIYVQHPHQPPPHPFYYYPRFFAVVTTKWNWSTRSHISAAGTSLDQRTQTVRDAFPGHSVRYGTSARFSCNLLFDHACRKCLKFAEGANFQHSSETARLHYTYIQTDFDSWRQLEWSGAHQKPGS